MSHQECSAIFSLETASCEDLWGTHVSARLCEVLGQAVGKEPPGLLSPFP